MGDLDLGPSYGNLPGGGLREGGCLVGLVVNQFSGIGWRTGAQWETPIPPETWHQLVLCPLIAR
jgi:hypothetical protein